jgi:hypothetical protein
MWFLGWRKCKGGTVQRHLMEVTGHHVSRKVCLYVVTKGQGSVTTQSVTIHIYCLKLLAVLQKQRNSVNQICWKDMTMFQSGFILVFFYYNAFCEKRDVDFSQIVKYMCLYDQFYQYTITLYAVWHLSLALSVVSVNFCQCSIQIYCPLEKPCMGITCIPCVHAIQVNDVSAGSCCVRSWIVSAHRLAAFSMLWCSTYLTWKWWTTSRSWLL